MLTRSEGGSEGYVGSETMQRVVRGYPLTRDSATERLRRCWAFREPATEFRCGACLQGIVAPRVGAECPVCHSRVEAVFELLEGGKPRLLGRNGRERQVRRDEVRLVLVSA